jgi:hypothetical protein
MSKQDEMEDIYQSYEYLFREKLEAMDYMARKMFSEMGLFGVPKALCDTYVQEKFKTLAMDVIEKGGKVVGRKDKLRVGRRKR